MRAEELWGGAALMADGGGLAALYAMGPGGGLMGAVALHGLACGLMLAAVLCRSRGLAGAARWRLCLHWLVLSIALPGIGSAVFLLAGWVGRWQARIGLAQRFEVLPSPSFQGLGGYVPAMRLGDRRHHLLAARLPVAVRMKALLSLQQTASRYSADVLRELLRDESDDIRLLAYGMLSGREKTLNGRIDNALSQYRGPGAAQTTGLHACARELAELYFEMLYQDMAQGDARQIAIDQVKHYAVEALRQQASDAGLWILMGRTRLLSGEADAALADFASAIAHGIPVTRITPYLAELAFLQGDYPSLRRHMRSLRETRLAQPLHQLVAYWAE